MKKKQIKFILILIVISNYIITNAEESLIDYNIKKYNRIMVGIRNQRLDTLSYGNFIVGVAKQFIGTPYEGGTLEGEGEYCRVNFRGMDCVTFPESVLAIAHTTKHHQFSFSSFVEYLAFIRYKNVNYYPEVDYYDSEDINQTYLYTDRIHYSSEWIFYHTVIKKTFEEITQKLGGERIQFVTDFMVNNTKYYPPLKDDKLVETLKEECETNKKRVFFYIPQNDISNIENKLKNGDFVFFVSNRKGLDYNHTGIIYIDESGKCKLMHASSSAKKIVISNKTLSEYVKSIKSDIGITIIRPIAEYE